MITHHEFSRGCFKGYLDTIFLLDLLASVSGSEWHQSLLYLRDAQQCALKRLNVNLMNILSSAQDWSHFPLYCSPSPLLPSFRCCFFVIVVLSLLFVDSFRKFQSQVHTLVSFTLSRRQAHTLIQCPGNNWHQLISFLLVITEGHFLMSSSSPHRHF